MTRFLLVMKNVLVLKPIKILGFRGIRSFSLDLNVIVVLFQQKRSLNIHANSELPGRMGSFCFNNKTVLLMLVK